MELDQSDLISWGERLSPLGGAFCAVGLCEWRIECPQCASGKTKDINVLIVLGS